MACGEPIQQRAPGNPNVCQSCCCEVHSQKVTEDVAAEIVGENRVRASAEAHPRRRRSAAVGDHSHERKTSPTLPRRKH
jgi:hypothetical protein